MCADSDHIDRVVDALGQVAGPVGLPVWPFMTLLVGAQAVAEGLRVALAFAAQATLLAAADAAWPPQDWWSAAAAALGYPALAFAVNRALSGEKRRLSAALAELARLKHGIGQLEDEASGAPATTTATHALRQVSGEGRRARQLDRALELDGSLRRIVDVTHTAVKAHGVAYFDVDRQAERAHLRASRGPQTLLGDCTTPLGGDPFSFVMERGQTFYATDFKRLLWDLPWYRGRFRSARCWRCRFGWER